MIFKAIIETVKKFMNDDPMSHAATIAFYTIISLPAILLLSINLLGVAYTGDSIEQNLLQGLNKYLGPSSARQAEIILDNATLAEQSSTVPWLGWIVLLISATTVFISLQNSINNIWKVKLSDNFNLFKLIKDRIISFGAIVSLGFILMVSLVIDSAISLLNEWIRNSIIGIDVTLIMLINYTLSIAVSTLVFSIIFKYLPDIKIQWRDVVVGGFITALLFSLGKFFIGLYLNNTDVGNAYGASGSLVVFLFWVYYSSILVLLGAKFTYEYTLLKEGKIESLDFATIDEENT